jgi:hypothetical protein
MAPNAWIGPVLLLAIAVVLGLRQIYRKFGWKPAVIAAVPVVLITALIVSVALQVRRLGAFAAFSDWCAAVSDTSSRPVREAPPVRGKFVPFFEGSRKASYDVFVHLPTTLRAETPDQVGAVVCIRPDVSQVGYYQPSDAPPQLGYTPPSGALAFARVWRVTVVHAGTRQVIATRTLRGSAPPKSSPKGRSGYGSEPYEELAAFLASLRTNPAP